MIKDIGSYISMSNQLILKFPSHQAYKKEDFYVSPSNQEAYDFINSWPKWIKRTVNIFGPSGSGKSHLASILKSKISSLQIEANNLNDETFFKFKTKEVLIIENLNASVSENLLFSLWNVALQDNKYLLITSTKPISSFKFKLRDLISRVTSSLIIGINLPSDDLISVILAKNFSDKQIKVEKKHIDYIIKRIDRSYEKISQFILTLDKYSLKKGSPFGLKLIKEVLKMI
jgi:chromosomal replication initiation ATPase DnaA